MPDSLIIKYNPFSTPADELALQKTLDYTRAGVFGGFLVAVSDLTISQELKSVPAALGRAGFLIGNAAVAGATYGAVLSAAGAIRGKDDEKNHFIGAFTAGAWLGSRFKARPVAAAFYTGLFAGVIAVHFKWAYMENGNKRRECNSYEGLPIGNEFGKKRLDVEQDPRYTKYFT